MLHNKMKGQEYGASTNLYAQHRRSEFKFNLVLDYKKIYQPILLCGLTLIPAIHDKLCLLSHLPTYFCSLYCKQFKPRSDCSYRSSLIRVHIVCLHDKSICSAFENTVSHFSYAPLIKCKISQKRNVIFLF